MINTEKITKDSKEKLEKFINAAINNDQPIFQCRTCESYNTAKNMITIECYCCGKGLCWDCRCYYRGVFPGQAGYEELEECYAKERQQNI